MGNRNLHKAKAKKNDEFYTRLEDIEKELQHYKQYFNNKVVYCNCDNPTYSNFWKFFMSVFEEWNIKKLIATYYTENEQSFVYVYQKGMEQPLKSPLHCDGDFRSSICIELLKEADIVVTNPPFSLFREYVAQLMEYNKKFLIIGNMNAVAYKEIFPFVKDNKIWLGYQNPKTFKQPDGTYKSIFTKWYTNLGIEKRHYDLDLRGNYYVGNEEKYPKYENYDAIEVSKVADIPNDYFGVMGVPITFLDKYNPNQFDILGATESEGKGFSEGLWFEESGVAQPLVGGKRKYKRIFIQRKES